MEIDYDSLGAVVVSVKWSNDAGYARKFYSVLVLNRVLGTWSSVVDVDDEGTAEVVAGVIEDAMTMHAALQEINRLAQEAT